MNIQKIAQCGTDARGLSMADAESIERTLGRLLTLGEFQNKEISYLRDGVSIIKNSVEASDKKDIELEMMMKAMHTRQDEHDERLKKTEGTLEEHEGWKNKGLGILAALSAFMAFAGYVFSNFVAPWIVRVFH